MKHLITAALPYANGGLHIGHLAGAYLPADIYSRYLRLRKKEVVFVCGSDEHGAAITIQAKKENTTPQELVDKNHLILKDTFDKMNISFDTYHRTSANDHHELSQKLFKQLHDTNKLVLKTSLQYYDNEAEQFLADRYITGTCPKCFSENAYGDQCEKCGSTLNPTDLISPRSTLSGNTPVLKETSHWYLPLNEYTDFLKQWIPTKNWKNAVVGQCNSWLTGLEPRAITRDLTWGVQVPLKDSEGKVLYVWFDAPIGYISATNAYTRKEGMEIDIWKQADTQLTHFIGKDNIVFHCIIFPVILHALGDYILPTNVPANEFLNLEGRKISTSKNYAVWVTDYLTYFPEQQDSLRYVLTAIAPETKDAEFTWLGFQERVNSELIAVLGNYVNRVLVLCAKYFSEVPFLKNVTEIDQDVLNAYPLTKKKVEQLLEGFHFRDAQKEVMDLARIGNRYLTVTEPWLLAKNPENIERIETILAVSLLNVVALSVLLKPFLPTTAEKICLATNHYAEWDEEIVLKKTALQPTCVLFSKIDTAQINHQLSLLQ